MINPSWDSLLLLVLSSFGILGFILRKSKVIPLQIAVYIAMALTSEVSLSVYRFLEKSDLGGFNSNLFNVQAIIFIIVTFLLFIEADYMPAPENKDSGISDSVQGAMWAVLAGAIALTAIVDFMPANEVNAFLKNTSVLSFLYPKKALLMMPFPIWLAFSSLIKRFR